MNIKIVRKIMCLIHLCCITQSTNNTNQDYTQFINVNGPSSNIYIAPDSAYILSVISMALFTSALLLSLCESYYVYHNSSKPYSNTHTKNKIELDIVKLNTHVAKDVRKIEREQSEANSCLLLSVGLFCLVGSMAQFVNGMILIV